MIKLSKLKSGKWSGKMFSFYNFRALDARNLVPRSHSVSRWKVRFPFPLAAGDLGTRLRCRINESETREREIQENKRGCMPRGSHRNLLSRPLIYEADQYQEPYLSVFILDPRLRIFW